MLTFLTIHHQQCWTTQLINMKPSSSDNKAIIYGVLLNHSLQIMCVIHRDMHKTMSDHSMKHLGVCVRFCSHLPIQRYNNHKTALLLANCQDCSDFR